MSFELSLSVFDEERPAVMVVSHERSGTHFLMNALATCYGYVSAPWLDFDHTRVNINYHHPETVRQLLVELAARRLANVVKSHHPSDFFRAEIDSITVRYVIFAIYRNPVDVMRSFWQFMHQWSWFEGPRMPDPVTFASAEPCGKLMRYQLRQYPSMLHRWSSHVQGWLDTAQCNERVVMVRYEDLDTVYEKTMRSFAPLLGREPSCMLRPARGLNVIGAGITDPACTSEDLESLSDLCLNVVGDTMSRLGYRSRVLVE